MAEADREIVADRAIILGEIERLRPSRWRARLLMLSVPFALALVGLWLWLSSGRFVSTDNAYVKQDIVSISSDVSGRIVGAKVRENQMVRAGDLLFQVDPQPYRVALAQADAAIAGAQVRVDQLRTDYASTGADIDSASPACPNIGTKT